MMPTTRWLALLCLTACSSSQGPFLGTYEALATTDYSFPHHPIERSVRRIPLQISPGTGAQLVFDFGATDGGGCLLTGTVQSSTTFSMDANGQGCLIPADAGLLSTVILQGAGLVDAYGILTLNQSGTVFLTDALGTTKGSFQQAMAGTRDGG